MKRIIVLFLSLGLISMLLFGCNTGDGEDSGKISIVCTTFPQYDWTREIIGDELADNFELTLLLDGRIDLHNYEPTVQDIAAIKSSDIFIYVGGESDDWVERVLEDANPDMIEINLIEVLGDAVLYEDDHDDHDHGNDDGHDDDEHDDDEHDDDEHDDDEHDDDEHDDDAEIDEHVWLSLRNAVVFSLEIADALGQADSANAQTYMDNAEAYVVKLLALDIEYQEVVEAASVTTLVFADRFPFLYLTESYGIEAHAAFSGCSAETEASLDIIIDLAEEIDEYELSVVMVTESTDQRIALSVIENTETKDQRILALDSMQSVTSVDIQNGVTYLSIMESNLNVLRDALS